MLKKLLMIFSLLLLVILGFYIVRSFNNNNILYSWSMDEVNDSSDLIELMKEFRIKTIYQDFSRDYLKGKSNIFLEKMNEEEIDVYYLTGDPNYDDSDIKERIDLVVNYNLHNKYKIKGIVLDIEPYLNNDFNDYDMYASNIELGYKYAREKGLYYVVVIPYWLDAKNEDALEKIIRNCDEISVMNYHIKDTTKNIKEEVKYVEKYNKRINTIYEVNANNDNSFTSYKDINYDFFKIKFNYFHIRRAYHYYESMKK